MHSPKNITLFFYTEDITLTGIDKQEEMAVLDGLSKIHTYMSEWEITTFKFWGPPLARFLGGSIWNMLQIKLLGEKRRQMAAHCLNLKGVQHLVVLFGGKAYFIRVCATLLFTK